jgi:hypothetical protein
MSKSPVTSDEVDHGNREENRDDFQMFKASRDDTLSDEVIRLREWGTHGLFSLCAPRCSEQPATMNPRALHLSYEGLADTTVQVEIIYEGQSWRIRDWSGISELKQDGRSTHEVSLMPGTEVAITGRTFIAESPRSIALRDLCSRLIGWSDDRIAVVDQALRAIRLAGSGRAPLVLSGSGDLIPVAYAIHRRTFGDEVPFVVSDPRRKNAGATVRSPTNHPRGMDAFRRASRGTLCVCANRLPHDFDDVLSAFREPESGVQLVVCSKDSAMSSAAGIEIPALAARCSEVPHIVSEYVDDMIDILHAPDNCLRPWDIQWIMQHAAFMRDATIADIEKAALRIVALRVTGNLTRAAKVLGMAPVSLERWLRRRHGDSL